MMNNPKGDDYESVRKLLRTYQHLDQTNNFIGSQFVTKKGSILTVVGWDGVTKNKFICHCDYCSVDKDLWEEGRLTSLKNNLCKGYVPCGCSKSTRWTEYQNLIRIKRECDSRNYIFHSFVGEYEGATTKLSLENPTTGNKWDSTTLTGFLRGIGDPVVGRELSRVGSILSIEQHTQDFLNTGKFLKGTLFKPSSDKKYFYTYTCPKCSYDEYTSEGLCTGVFNGFIGHLKAGKLSCRCATNYNWTEKQREYQLKGILKKEDLAFVGWETEYKRYTSYFLWSCKEGHKCKTSVDNFIRGNRCSTCAQLNGGGGNGHYPTRQSERDYLYVISLDNLFIKCGRSFNPKNRAKEIQRTSGHKVTVLYTFTGLHKEVYKVEQEIKCSMYAKYLNYYDQGDNVWGGSTECYKKESLTYILELIKASTVELNNGD